MNRQFCASAFIIDPNTLKILLVKHKKFEKWVQPGGHIEENETPEEAAVREVFEETGIRVRLLGAPFPREDDFIRPLGVQKNRNKKGQLHIDFIYAAIPYQISELIYDPNESLDIGWFSRNDLENMAVFQDIKITMEYILKTYFRR